MRWSVACAALGLLALAAALVWPTGGARAEGWIWLAERTASSLTVNWRWFGPAAAFELGWRASGDGASTVWRTARVSGAERSYRIAGLESEVRHVVRVRALDANGRMLGDLRGAFTPRDAEPLQLGVRLRYSDSCTAAGMRELFWNIYGGVPPYTLTIDGEPADLDRGDFSVFCGLRPSDPQPCDPEPKLRQTFKAVLTDSRGVTAEVELQAVVAVPPNRLITGSVLSPAVASSTTVRLTWEARARLFADDSTACAYELRYQSTDWKADSWPDSWTTISETIGPDETEYLHDGLLPNRRYRYQVRARNNIGESEWSHPFPRTAARPGAAVLSASTAVSGSVVLNWSAAQPGALRWEYRQRSAGGGWSAWTAIAGSDARTTTHTVSDLIEDARYHFQVRAANAAGPGRASASATTAAGLTPTPSPTVIRYDEYDATGGALRSNSYAFLTDAADLTSGATTFAEVSGAEALLFNVSSSYTSRAAEVLAAVEVGDRVTWFISCWYHYRVTEILPDPPAPARKLFRIALEAEDPCVTTPAQLDDPDHFAEARDWFISFYWEDHPPSQPKIGSDGIRILPTDYPVEGGHTYRLSDYGAPSRIVIDVPASMRLIYTGGGENSDGTTSVTLMDEASRAVLLLAFGTGSEQARYVPPEYSASGETRDVGALFDAISASARRQPER